MNTNFCKNCDNFMFTYKDLKTNKLYNGCKVCGNKDEIEKDKEIVYKSNISLNVDEVLNENMNLKYDNTLPYIANNPNFQCINKECKAKTSKIKYIKFDSENMKYLYICDTCGQKWTNKNI